MIRIMKKKYPLLFVAVFVLNCFLPMAVRAQSCDPIDPRQLKEMLIGMGYTVKDLNTEPGKEKFEITVVTSSFNVPLGYEISPSKNYVWITAMLGTAMDSTSTKNAALLRQNFSIQPCQFYITTKGNLMMGLAIENRGLTAAIMRRHTDKISSDVSKTGPYWQ